MSVRPSVRPSVRLSVCPSVRPSVRPSVTLSKAMFHRRHMHSSECCHYYLMLPVAHLCALTHMTEILSPGGHLRLWVRSVVHSIVYSSSPYRLLKENGSRCLLVKALSAQKKRGFTPLTPTTPTFNRTSTYLLLSGSWRGNESLLPSSKTLSAKKRGAYPPFRLKAPSPGNLPWWQLWHNETWRALNDINH